MAARHRLRPLAAVIGALALLASLATLPAPAATVSTVTFVMRSVERRDPACKAAPPECSSIKLEFPEFTRAPSDAAKQALNQAVSVFILKDLSGEKPLKSVAEVVGDFFRQAAEAQRSSPLRPPWALERVVLVKYNAAAIVSLEFSTLEFTGGAHPNGWATLASHSASTGRRLNLKDLLVSGFEPKLNAIAERYFRQARELKPDTSLEAAGFTFKNGKFSVNSNNFMITAKGLVFFFNSYEIAAYFVGPTEFLVPYAAIRHLIRPSGPLTAVR